MKISSPTLRVGATAPETVRRLEMIVSAVAALIARRFLRDPRYLALIVPLWGWLNRTVRRFSRVPVVAAPKVVRAAQARKVAVPRVRMPTGKAWLVKALGWEAAGFGCQLQALLAEPEMVALLAAVPRAQRVLRSLGRMLGVVVGPVGGGPGGGAGAEASAAGGAQAALAAGEALVSRADQGGLVAEKAGVTRAR